MVRVAHFLVVWSGLLFIHEYGHAWMARRQGHAVGTITVGAGPELWRGSFGESELVLRLVPVVGMTRISPNPVGAASASLTSRGIVFAAGIVFTAAAAILIIGLSMTWERVVRRRCTWGRMIVADAVVLSVFNLLPVPPLDGGRAVLEVLTALRGTPLSGDALFWTQVSGLALAVLPMTVWNGWTKRIDWVAMRWRAPRSRGMEPAYQR
jgi:membrane-associated protease RseP (regulator of RpoE activity)